MALTTAPETLTAELLNARIDSLRTGFAGHREAVRQRNVAYLRAFSPPFESKIGEHDQWPDGFPQGEAEHFRSSYNVTRAAVELWNALEMSEFPAIRWYEGYIPLPAPSLDEAEQAARMQVYRTQKHYARSIATMREQALMRHVRRTKLLRHVYRSVRRKNIYGHAWLKTVPDLDSRTFRVFSRIDPSTVYPVWSGADDDRLEAILVAVRRSAPAVAATYPQRFDGSGPTIELTPDGMVSDNMGGYYSPTPEAATDADRAYAWVEDFWMVDATWEEPPSDDGGDETPIRSRVINVIRANGHIADIVWYPGWTRVPYVLWQNENDRDHLGFSDVASMLPIQDSINRFMSQQQDVIAGSSRPIYKYRGDSTRVLDLEQESVVALDPDEDIEQIQTRIDVFPTQIHGQQILEMLARVMGLPDTVWGRITAAQNSGRALATAWRSVAARMVPRTHGNSTSIEWLLGDLWLGWMELYDWDDARQLFGAGVNRTGNREFELDFPNQEPRDFAEVTLNAINRMQAGLIDEAKAMEETGERSPDEMLDRVRASYMDPVMHPDKQQAYLLLQRLKNQIAMEVQQFGMQQAAAQIEMAQAMNQPPGGAAGPGTVDQQAGAARQAQVEAQQRGAPARGQDQNAPATQAGQTGNAASKTKTSTMVQDGSAFNRIVDQGEI